MSKDRVEYHREYRKNNADKLREYNNEYRKKNADKISEQKRKRRKDNPEWVKLINKEKIPYHNEYRKKNNDEIRKRQRKYLEGYVTNIYDGYVRRLLIRQFKITNEHITPELIEMKREQLIKYRLLKEIKNGLNK